MTCIKRELKQGRRQHHASWKKELCYFKPLYLVVIPNCFVFPTWLDYPGALFVGTTCKIMCSAGLAKTILQGTKQGGRSKGRQKKWWENTISEWKGLKFCEALRESKNRIKWKERVASSVALRRSWDRCKAQGVHVLHRNSIGSFDIVGDLDFLFCYCNKTHHIRMSKAH